jgi:hypothetical protein
MFRREKKVKEEKFHNGGVFTMPIEVVETRWVLGISRFSFSICRNRGDWEAAGVVIGAISSSNGYHGLRNGTSMWERIPRA